MESNANFTLKNYTLAFLGSMGIPATYGGSETFVHELSLVLKPFFKQILVSCGTKDPKSAKKHFKGIRLLHIKRRSNKFIDFPIRSLMSVCFAILYGSNIIHFTGAENSPFILMARLFGKKCVLTLDGLHWKRKSYPTPIRFLLRLNARFSIYTPHIVVADNKLVQKWFRKQHKKLIYYIPYGAHLEVGVDVVILEKYDLKMRDYYLFVGRLVKEKNVEDLIDVFNKGEGLDRKLVIIGDDDYNKEYVKYLKNKAKKNIQFLGFVYGKEYKEITKGAYLYITPSTLEGTSPALLSAMGFGNCVLASNIPENKETIGDSGFFFQAGNPIDLREKLQFLDSNPDIVEKFRKKAIERIKRQFNWIEVAKKYIKYYNILINDH